MALSFAEFAVMLGDRRLAALDGTIPAGGVLSVMGPSGTGKSSLLRAVAGLSEPPFRTSGRLTLFGTEITALPAEARGIGLMFQDALLLPHLSVAGNVMFAVRRRAPTGQWRSRIERRRIALAHLARVGLDGLAERDPQTLSGGEKSRVALARTLSGEPRALLLDEPFAALDQALRAQTRTIVFALARQDDLPVLMVSHDPADSDAAGGPVVTLDGAGRDVRFAFPSEPPEPRGRGRD